MEFVEQLKSAVNILNVIGEWVRLRKAGTYRYSGLCPFHSEKTPSFSVNVDKQFYYCFGCHAKGDVVNFVMEMAIAQAFHVEVITDACAKSGDQRSDLVAAQNLVKPGALCVHDLASQRQDSLEVPVASLLGGAASRVTFHNVQFCLGRISL